MLVLRSSTTSPFARKIRIAISILGLEDEKIGGTPLLIKMIDNGIVVYNQPALSEIRESARKNLSRLPVRVADLTRAAPYPVRLSPKLKKLTLDVAKSIRRKARQ